MKEGTKVKVKARHTRHGFCVGQIVERRASELDDEFGVGFVCDKGDVWYMQPDEYDLVGGACEQLLKEALSAAEAENFSTVVIDCILLALEEVSFEKNQYH